MDKIVLADGNPNSGLMIIGEAPGHNELQAGRPFIGASGKILWGTLSRYGLDRTQCYITNVYSKRPEGKAGAPTKEQILEDWERLNEDMLRSEARVLLLLGRYAAERVTGLPIPITGLHGYVIYPKMLPPRVKKVWGRIGVYKTNRRMPRPIEGSLNAWQWKYRKGDPKMGWLKLIEKPVLPPKCEAIVCCLHPSTVQQRGFENAQDFRAAIKRATTVLVSQVLDENLGHTSFPLGERVVAVDIETPMEDFATIYQISFAGEESSISIPWGEEAAMYTRSLLLSSEHTLVFHNASFDVPILERTLGIKHKCQIFCTMLAAQILTPDLPKGLEKVAPRHLALTPWKHMKDRDLGFYNRKDSVVARKLEDILEKDLRLTGQFPVFQSVMEAMPVLWEAEREGIRIDQAAAARWVEELSVALQALLSGWPYPDADPGSPKQMVSLLYNRLGLPVQKNKFGSYTTDEAALNFLLTQYPDHEVLTSLLRYRKLTRDIALWSKLPVGGTIHPRFMPKDKDDEKTSHGASTLRIQARDPNVMNLDRKGRHMLIPREGSRFLYADWSQAEARVEAEIADDDILRQAINDGLHDTNAKVLGVDKIRAKNFFYGTGRGAGPRKLVLVFRAEGFFGVTEAECREAQETLFRTYRKWAAKRMEIVAQGKNRGYIENPFGLRRYFQHSSSVPKMLGWIPQSTVAVMLWKRLLYVQNLRTPMHDAVLTEATGTNWFPEGFTPARELVNILHQPFHEINPGWFCPADVKVGLPNESWGAMEDRYEREKNESKSRVSA